MTEQKAPREFWIAEEYEGFIQVYLMYELALESAWNNDPDNVTHVIEKSAFDALQSERDALRAEVERLKSISDMRFRAMDSLAKELDEKDPLIGKLRSEIQILRRGLVWINEEQNLWNRSDYDLWQEVRKKAREALREADKLAKDEK